MTADREVLLELRGVRGGYGDIEVLHGLDLEVRAGEILALLGPNGAGKTTTLNAMCGLIRVTDGEVLAFGKPIDKKRPWRQAQRGLAQVPEDRALFRDLTTAENLDLAARGGPRASSA